MYTHYHQLKCRAFENTLQPSFIWLGKSRQGIVDALCSGIVESSGLQILTGVEGVGKSVLLQKVLMNSAEQVNAVLIQGIGTTPLDFYNEITTGFGLSKQVESKVQFVLELTSILHLIIRRGKRPLLAMDNAHTLSKDNLEDIRLLLSLEEGGEPLLNVLLVGDDELARKLSLSSNNVLLQRLACHAQLESLNLQEVRDYVTFRLSVAGAERVIFDETAFASLLLYSGGQPGLINTFCTSILEEAAQQKENYIEASFIDWMFGNHNEIKSPVEVLSTVQHSHKNKEQVEDVEKETKTSREERETSATQAFIQDNDVSEIKEDELLEFTLVEDDETSAKEEIQQELPPLFPYSSEEFAAELSVVNSEKIDEDFYNSLSDDIEISEEKSVKNRDGNVEDDPFLSLNSPDFIAEKERIGNFTPKWEEWAITEDGEETEAQKDKTRREKKRVIPPLLWKSGAGVVICFLFFFLYRQLTSPTIETSPVSGSERVIVSTSLLKEEVPLVDMPLTPENIAYGMRLNQIPAGDTLENITSVNRSEQKVIAIQPLLIVE